MKGLAQAECTRIFNMIENPYPGIFIAVEGMDGAGKTEQARRIAAWFGSKGYAARYTKEPSYTDGSQNLRRAITGLLFLSPLDLQTLFVKDREMHLTMEIIPELGKKNPVAVVSDRYFLSTMAYGMAQGITFETLWELHQRMRHFVLPDLTLVVDVPPAVALARLGKRRDSPDIFEKEEMLAKIQERYHELAQMFKNDHVVLIQDESPPEEIFRRIASHLEKVVRTKYER